MIIICPAKNQNDEKYQKDQNDLNDQNLSCQAKNQNGHCPLSIF